MATEWVLDAQRTATPIEDAILYECETELDRTEFIVSLPAFRGHEVRQLSITQ